MGLFVTQVGMAPKGKPQVTARIPGLTFLLQLLHVPQLLHIMGVTEPQLHAHKGLPPLQAQLVPGLGPGQEVRHGALRQPQDALPKQPLP